MSRPASIHFGGGEKGTDASYDMILRSAHLVDTGQKIFKLLIICRNWAKINFMPIIDTPSHITLIKFYFPSGASTTLSMTIMRSSRLSNRSAALTPLQSSRGVMQGTPLEHQCEGLRQGLTETEIEATALQGFMRNADFISSASITRNCWLKMRRSLRR